MNLEFMRIEVQNFKSIGEKVELDFQSLKGLNFVYGKNLDVQNAKNGSGKSTLMVDALSFALFGRTLKNTSNRYIPNRSVSDRLKPSVKLTLRSDGQLYSCEAYGRIVAKVMGNVGMELLRLNEDGSVAEDLTQSTVAKTKQYIQDNILGCTFNVFKSSVIMASADFMNFYEGMNRDQKRKYVESIFSLDCFGEMFSMVKADLNDTKREVTAAKNQLISLSERIDSLKAKSAGYLEDRNARLQELKGRLAGKKAEIIRLKGSLDGAEPDGVDGLKAEKVRMEAELTALQRRRGDIEKAMVRLESAVAHNGRMIGQTIGMMEGLCEKCAEFVKGKYGYAKYESENARHKADLGRLSAALSAVDGKAAALKEGISATDAAIDRGIAERMRRDRVQTLLKCAVGELAELKRKREEYESGDGNPFAGILAEAERESEGVSRRLSGFLGNIRHFEVLRDATSENGVKRAIMKDIVKLLNSLIQKYLNEIGCEFIVYFDETFDFRFITTTGECEFSSFSAGEKQRIQIATLLAFRDLILSGKVSSNVFIIDELLDANVDTACIENVMGILKRKASETGQSVFIISHRSELADNMGFWNSIIKVTKENQQSRYEVI